LLEDITASSAHAARALVGKHPRHHGGAARAIVGGLLQTIVAGSPLVEGDQVYLASRCFIDTRETDRAPASVVDQIVDALIWRSHPGNLRPYADRKRAATTLAELRHPNAIPHLVSLASEELATGWGTEKRYEFSGIRLVAVNGLMLMQDAAKQYVHDERPALEAVVAAWWTAYEKEIRPDWSRSFKGPTKPPRPSRPSRWDSTMRISSREPTTAALHVRRTLLDVFAKDDTDRDLGWAVADTFTLIDPMWVSTNVIEPRLQTFTDPRVPYLIGCLGMAAEGSKEREYLEQCLARGIPAVRKRERSERSALSSRFEAHPVRIRSRRRLGEGAAGHESSTGDRRRRSQPPAERGDGESARDRQCRVDRGPAGARQRAVGMTITLRQLSFDVAEDIYWRLTGPVRRKLRPA
jgi:hypothetical protein